MFCKLFLFFTSFSTINNSSLDFSYILTVNTALYEFIFSFLSLPCGKSKFSHKIFSLKLLFPHYAFPPEHDGFQACLSCELFGKYVLNHPQVQILMFDFFELHYKHLSI